MGGFIAAYGAKIAKGCTSGQALTGGAMLDVGSLSFMVSVCSTCTRDALGMLCGVLAYADVTPGLEAWYKATAQGEMTLPSVSGIGMGTWTLAFIAFLLFAAWGLPRIEARFAGWRPAA